MGRAVEALKQTLEQYGVGQGELAIALSPKPSNLPNWFQGPTELSARNVISIVKALEGINPEASQYFMDLCLGELKIDRELSELESKHLPPSEDVDVSALSQLFSNTTNSYKYLFFTSLLDILGRGGFEVTSPIYFSNLIIEMLANAWYPHTYFKLSFGSQDKIAQKLDNLTLEITEPILRFTDTDKKQLREAIASQDLKDIISHFRRYVPFRLIAPFFKEELRLEGIDRGKGNELDMAMPRIAQKYFDSRKPLYCFDSDQYRNCQSIKLHPSWSTYFENNYAIVRGWVSWKWLNYMQARNPSVPSVVNKIFMPQQRGALSRQTKYWKQVLEHQTIHCIYSKQVLDLDNIALDHYLPWSFVAHDQLWNLVPVIPAVNSSKSNNLPSQQYFKDFVEVQHLGLTTCHNLGERVWNSFVESYISDLKASSEDLLDWEKLNNAYEEVLQPLLTLAAQQGFTPNWKY